MEKLRTIIVEDEKDAAEQITKYLGRYSAEKGIGFNIRHYADVTSFSYNYHNDADLIFMDIELPDGDGMSAVEKLRKTDSEVTVIFVTNMSQYAVKGYEVKAFDFIVKPVGYNNFSTKLTSAVDYIRKRSGKDLWISNKDGKMRIRTSRIKYIEIIQHILIFHTLDGDFKESGTLNNILEELRGEPFSLCNRCYIVNLRFITAVKQFDLYLDDTVLQISRLRKNSFLSDLNDYLAGGV